MCSLILTEQKHSYHDHEIWCSASKESRTLLILNSIFKDVNVPKNVFARLVFQKSERGIIRASRIGLSSGMFCDCRWEINNPKENGCDWKRLGGWQSIKMQQRVFMVDNESEMPALARIQLFNYYICLHVLYIILLFNSRNRECQGGHCVRANHVVCKCKCFDRECRHVF